MGNFAPTWELTNASKPCFCSDLLPRALDEVLVKMSAPLSTSPLLALPPVVALSSFSFAMLFGPDVAVAEVLQALKENKRCRLELWRMWVQQVITLERHWQVKQVQNQRSRAYVKAYIKG